MTSPERQTPSPLPPAAAAAANITTITSTDLEWQPRSPAEHEHDKLPTMASLEMDPTAAGTTTGDRKYVPEPESQFELEQQQPEENAKPGQLQQAYPNAASSERQYFAQLKELEPAFPHLRSIGGLPLDVMPLVDIVDFSRAADSSGGDGGAEVMTRGTYGGRPGTSSLDVTGELVELASALDQHDPQLASRLIVVTDLSPSVVSLLGSRLSIDPEFWATHLAGSATNHICHSGSTHRSAAAGPALWSSGGLRKPFTSQAWLRPVHIGFRARALHRLVNAVWKFGPPGFQACYDHLPATSPVDAAESRYLECTAQVGAVASSSNIYRCFYNVAAVPEADVNEKVGYVLPQQLGPVREPYASEHYEMAWMERASVWQADVGGVSTVVMLLDPIPSLDVRLRTDPSSRHTCAAYEPVAPRGAYSGVWTTPSPSSLSSSSSIQDDRTTHGTILRWLQEYCAIETRAHTPIALSDFVQTALARVCTADTRTLLARMERTLNTITQDTTDDARVQRHLQWYRQLLARYGLLLRMLDESLGESIEFVQREEFDREWGEDHREMRERERRGGRGGRRGRTGLPIEVGALCEKVQRTLALTDRTASSLLASLSLIESKRAIREAESVTKLTELAFFFIPLGFSASIFGMQLKEFQNNVELTDWIAVALCVTIGSYGVRLLIRSSVLISFKQRLHTFIRARAALREDTPIPSRLFILLPVTLVLAAADRGRYYASYAFYKFFLLPVKSRLLVRRRVVARPA